MRASTGRKIYFFSGWLLYQAAVWRSASTMEAAPLEEPNLNGFTDPDTGIFRSLSLFGDYLNAGM
jgi:hypothetical protein